MDCKNPQRHEILRKAVEAGKVKIQWKIAKFTYEQIFGSIITGKMKLRDSMFKKVTDTEFQRRENKFVG